MQNGERYANNYARAAAYFLGTCAARPETPGRQAAYELITGVYAAVARDAALLGFKPAEDVFFDPWEQQRERQKDVKTIRSAIDKVDALAAELYALVTAGTACERGLLLPAGAARPKRALTKALAEMGVSMEQDVLLLPVGCAEGLTELAGISRAHTIPITDGPQADKAHLYFSRCVFDPKANWAAAAFDRMLGANGQLLRLCDALEERGYRRVDCKDGKRISVDYVKPYGRKAAPVKVSWADKVHAGVEVTYEDLRLAPCFVWLRMPMYADVLTRAAELPAEARAFLVRHTKTCDGCRYCVQTDRTGTRPLAAISVDGKKKCPYYPSFTMNWRTLPESLVSDMLTVLDALEALGLR